MTVPEQAEAARRAGRRLAALEASARSALLRDLADAWRDPAARAAIAGENAADLADARDAAARGELRPALVARLALGPDKLDAVADGLAALADLPDPVGATTVRRELDDGLVLQRVTCPLGVVGAVFEARPDALPQIAGLCLRSGNASLLKGGHEALRTNRAAIALSHAVLRRHGLDPACCTLLEDRDAFAALLRLDGSIELVVARGSGAFVRSVTESTKIPVLGHADGICHVYLHGPVDPEMAARIAVDAKVGYPAACNAVETLLWEPGAGPALDRCVEALSAAGVELRACAATRERRPGLRSATDADWDTEYGELVLSIRRVSDVDQALAHIARHGSRHTEAILTDDSAVAARFLAEVDAASVFHNASTRFADGYRFGLGAEVGISTGKLHARGPVGVEGLTTYRWLLHGHGQIAADYGPGKRPFRHRDL
jgi:glutamate-5-semialdehyde dehydrogenase